VVSRGDEIEGDCPKEIYELVRGWTTEVIHPVTLTLLEETVDDHQEDNDDCV